MLEKTEVTWSSIRRRYIEFDSGGVATITLEDFLKDRGISAGSVHGRTKVNVFDVAKIRYILGNIMALKIVDDLEDYEVDFEDLLDIFIKEYKMGSKVSGIYFGVCSDVNDETEGMFYSSIEGLKQDGYNVTQINKLKLVYLNGLQQQNYYFSFNCQYMWDRFLSSDKWFEEFLCGICLNIKKNISE